MSNAVSGPSEIGAEALTTDPLDEDELRELCLQFIEDSQASDLDTMEDRASGFLSDIRRAKAGDLDE